MSYVLCVGQAPKVALVAPPLGNSLAIYSARMPFILWAAMAFFGLAALGFLRHGKTQPESPVSGVNLHSR